MCCQGPARPWGGGSPLPLRHRGPPQSAGTAGASGELPQRRTTPCREEGEVCQREGRCARGRGGVPEGGGGVPEGGVDMWMIM